MTDLLEVRPPLQQLLLAAVAAPRTHLRAHSPQPLQAVVCELVAGLDGLWPHQHIAAAAVAGLQRTPAEDDGFSCWRVVHLPAVATHGMQFAAWVTGQADVPTKYTDTF